MIKHMKNNQLQYMDSWL